MANTYEVTDNEKEQFVVEIKMFEDRRTYQKAWLEEEIPRLQNILDKFDK